MKPDSKKFRTIGMYVIALALIVVSFFIVLFNFNARINDTVNSTTDYVYEATFDEIMLYLNNLVESAKENSQETANIIRNSLISKYTDNKSLKEALDNIGSKGILDIFHDVLEDRYFNDVENYDNDIFIANSDGIIYDLNYQNIKNGDTMMKLWKKEREGQYNKNLFDSSLIKLLEQNTDDYIVFERTRPDNDIHKSYKTITRENLLEVYKNEGVEGFKNYIFLVPSYIYNHKDILGTSDFINGVKVKNYKIIVVQEFNLYDQINKHYSYLADFDKEHHAISLLESMEYSFREACTILCISIIVFILVLCCMYNYLMGVISPDNDEQKEKYNK